MRVLVAGDYVPMERVSTQISLGKGEEIFSQIKHFIQDADYAIVNLEAPIRSSQELSIEKSGRHLFSDSKSIKLLSSVGFQCCTLANNHVCDYGSEGVIDTINAVRESGLDYVGAGQNLHEASSYLLKHINGVRVAVVNACEHEFSVATSVSAGANPIDLVRLYKQIIEARRNADYLLAIIHGGHEYYQLPSPRMKELYHFLVDIGCDAVVNHHQHCFSGYEVYNGKPIFYGLGNFCFDRRDKRDCIWNEGYLVSINFDKNVTFEIYPYVQCNDKPVVQFQADQTCFRNKIEELNSIIADDETLNKFFRNFVKERKRKNVFSIFSPYHSSLLRIAAGHGLIPKFLPKSRARAIYNYIYCETHYDETVETLREYLDS